MYGSLNGLSSTQQLSKRDTDEQNITAEPGLAGWFASLCSVNFRPAEFARYRARYDGDVSKRYGIPEGVELLYGV